MITFELPRVIRVWYVRDHVLRLRFSDGLEGEVDLSHELHGEVFEPLRDPAFFARARVDGQTIVWPNGADWAPETLHALVAAAHGIDADENDGGRTRSERLHVRVPEISRFFGIVVTMYYVDHARPHFHARFGEQSIAMEIDGDGLNGSFPPHRLPLLFEWRDAHRAELRENWDHLRHGRPPLAIPPLV